MSYYDYYQPEAYVPTTDTFIEKDSSINEEIERLRLAATGSLISRRDVIVVASVSCIYGLGSPDDFRALSHEIVCGEETGRDFLLEKLVDGLYNRNDVEQSWEIQGSWRYVDIFPAYANHRWIEFWGDEVESIRELDATLAKPSTKWNATGYTLPINMSPPRTNCSMCKLLSRSSKLR